MPPVTTLLRIAVATIVAAARRRNLPRLELVKLAGDAGRIPDPDTNVPRIARARRPAISPFTRARPKKTTKKFRRFFAHTSKVPDRMFEAFARRGGGGKYGYAPTEAGKPGGAVGGTPGGVACGEMADDAVAMEGPTSRPPQFVQNRFVGRFKVPHDGQTLEEDNRAPSSEDRSSR